MKVLIVQPALLHYRRRVYNALADWCEVTVVTTEGQVDDGWRRFRLHEVACISKLGFHWQRGLPRLLRETAPDAVWLCADVNFLSSLALLVICRRRGIRVILHGQGFVKPSRSAAIRQFLVKTWISLADRYASYAPICTESLLQAGIPADSITTINNRLEPDAVSPAATDSNRPLGVLFVGRLRPGCQIGALIRALEKINRSRDEAVVLHVVGDGELSDLLKAAPSWIRWHGSVTEEEQLKTIAANCSLGVYPGSAGLSVLTYMQMGLAPIVAADITFHMGPEPSFVVDTQNGWTFDHQTPEDLERVIAAALESPRLAEVCLQAYRTFQDLHRRSYAEEMAELLMEVGCNSAEDRSAKQPSDESQRKVAARGAAR